MWDKLWRRVHLATLAPSNTPYGAIQDGAIAVKNGKIVRQGREVDLPGPPSELAHQVLEIQGEWITPGLIDCHTHLVFAGQRADEFARKLQGESYASILGSGGGILSSVRATRRSSFEELLECSSQPIRFAMRQGVTTLEIKSGYGLYMESELNNELSISPND
jgi:imidazolonepropionase